MTELTIHEQTQEIILEGLQMATEANSAAMIVFNAKLQMIADNMGIDISEPVLTEIEERNKKAMLDSVGKRLMKIMKMSANMEDAPEPTPAEMADALEAVKNEIWPDGSVTGRTRSDVPNEGTLPKSEDAPVDEFHATKERLRSEAERPVPAHTTFVDDSEVRDDASVDKYPTPNPFAGSVFEGAEPVENIFVEDGVSDDTTADEDTATFKSQRALGTLNLKVASLQDFEDIDVNDLEARDNRWVEIVNFYGECAHESAAAGKISQEWADRILEECKVVAGMMDEATSPMSLPVPGDIFNGVTTTAAEGETDIEITGITSEEQIVEGIVTAFMVTAARFNTVISTALLQKRLEHIGMST